MDDILGTTVLSKPVILGKFVVNTKSIAKSLHVVFAELFLALEILVVVANIRITRAVLDIDLVVISHIVGLVRAEDATDLDLVGPVFR